MAASVLAASRSITQSSIQTSYPSPKPDNLMKGVVSMKKNIGFSICLAMHKRPEEFLQTVVDDPVMGQGDHKAAETISFGGGDNKKEHVRVVPSLEEKLERKKSERTTYLVAAIMSSVGITSLAAFSVYYRFASQMEDGELPLLEMFGTFSLAVGAALGMEYWARWAHKALWHDSLWPMHKSHHRPREGPFELNDVFAIINAFPAISLLYYGIANKGLVPGLCFGAGLGITMFGMAYMFVHDGLVHRRFPVGPIANVPYLRRVAAAHQLHHAETFDGVPYGLFLGPEEVEKIGGRKELERETQRRIKQAKANQA